MDYIDLQPQLGRRIVGWRKGHGISRRHLAKATGIAHQTLKQIEDGLTFSPRIHSLIQISGYFEKSLGELLGEYLPNSSILVKVPSDIHLTEVDKSQLRMRIAFELDILRKYGRVK